MFRFIQQIGTEPFKGTPCLSFWDQTAGIKLIRALSFMLDSDFRGLSPSLRRYVVSSVMC